MLVTSNHPLMSDWDKNKVGVELEELGLVFRVTVYASTPSNSGGRGDFGCLLSKCCLKVFGSGIWDCRKGRYIYFREMAQALYFADFSMIKRFNTDLFFLKTDQMAAEFTSQNRKWKAFFPILILALHTRQVNTSAAFAAVFWSWPLAFFISACFLAFFCWDWIFWCPRAILAKPEEKKARENDLMFSDTRVVWTSSTVYYCWHTSTLNKSS